MVDASDQEVAGASLAKIRRHIRILVDLGRLAGESADLASISIQMRRQPSPDVRRVLDHVANRINAISLAHDQLTPRQDRQVVRLSDYIRALCSTIGQQSEAVEVNVEADELELTIDRAVPLGL